MSQVFRLHAAVLGLLLCAGTPPLKADPKGQTLSHEFPSLDGNFVAERVLEGLSQPAALEFLPDGRLLIAQRDRGLITVADPATGAMQDITGLPRMVVYGDAGVHDIELHPDYAQNGWIYVSYTDGEEVHCTAVLDRFRLEGSRAVDVQRVFTADAYSEDAYHLAARMAFVDGYLFVAFGDRQHPPKAQDNSNHAGAVVRLKDDGSVPGDNPFVGVEEEGKPKPRPEIWSYGHRDPMGLYRHPESGELWLHEHGPRGGDEINLVLPGRNYGWPEITFGKEYWGPLAVGEGTERDDVEPPVKQYTPSIAPDVHAGAAAPLRHNGRGRVDSGPQIGSRRAGCARTARSLRVPRVAHACR